LDGEKWIRGGDTNRYATTIHNMAPAAMTMALWKRLHRIAGDEALEYVLIKSLEAMLGFNGDEALEYVKKNKKLPTPVSAVNVEAKTDVKTTLPINVEMNCNIWYKWSEKSKDIPFESSITGVGHGEQKVACELDTHSLGQNSSYDMIPMLNGVMSKCDVKKLDAQNDFNTGKDGRDALRPIKTSISNLLASLNTFAKSDVFTPDEKGMLLLFYDVSPDELAVGTLKKLEEMCSMLYLKKKTLRSTLPLVPFTVYSQTSDMPLDLFYTNCQKLGLVFPSEFSSRIETLEILHLMDHVYINEPKKLVNDLHSLISKIFTDMKIIIADKDKGYMILEDISKIQFYRITRGHPRFKIVF